MTDQDFNPYSPPETRIDEPSAQVLGSGEYRIEKNTLIIREPCRLPRVCFWSGAVSDLIDCEFKIRVMPRWWAFVMPILIFGHQILVVPLMQFVMPKLNGPGSGVSPILPGILIGVGQGFLIICFIGMMRYAGRLVTLYASYSKDNFLKRRRKWRNLIFGVMSAAILILGSFWFWLGRPWILLAFALLPIPLGLIISLRLRKPWAYVFGSLTKHGDIVISGLRPEFFLTLRQLQTIAFQGDEDRM